MSNVITLSRSFGKLVSFGKEVLGKEGHKLFFPPEDCLPLDEKRITNLIQKFNIDAIVVGAERITPNILDTLGSRKIVAKHGAGLDNIDIRYATKSNIAVTFTPEANVQAVAELTVGLILCIARRIPKACFSMKNGDWEYFMGKEIYGKIIGVIGTGKIGKAVIQKLSGMNVNILVYDIVTSKEISSLQNVKYVDLKEIFTNSDFITLHVPLTQNTYRMIGENEFKLMKASSYFINTSRGSIVDELALYKFLSSKKIAGAALDVWENEPPKSISAKLVKLDNVIPTPHIGAYTEEAIYRMGHQCAMSIIDFFNNKKPKYLANPDVWKNLGY
jgi:D-3-phosphoglycerate dehydrogenase